MKRGLKTLGLSVLSALSLMAFTAGGTQAQEFLTSAGTFKALGIASETISGAQVGLGLMRILNLNLLLKCETGSVAAGSLIFVLGHGKANITFSKCYVTDLALKKAACTVPDINANVLALIILHGAGNHAYILFEPQVAGGIFALVTSSGAFCTLPKHAEVKGSVVAEILNPLSHQVKPRFAITEATLNLFTNDKLFYGANEGHLIAEAEVWLNGANNLAPWGAS